METSSHYQLRTGFLLSSALDFSFLKLVLILPLCAMLTGCAFLGDPGSIPDGESDPPPEISEPPVYTPRHSPAEPLPPPPLQVNLKVLTEIKSLIRGNSACIRVSRERRDPLLAVYQQIFRDEGIPEDLLNLGVIESRFNHDARSYSGALGIWQFTRGTAKEYGLRIDGRVDQRKDPILSTIAAARMLRELYFRFKDWYLALAAYNAGPAAISRALRRSGAVNFWDLSRSKVLSRQTNEFVPRFIAATLLMRLSEIYGVDRLEELVHENVHERSLERSVKNLASLLGSSLKG